MSIFAISDLHLSFASEKPMDRFGPEWVNHADKVAHNWRDRVGEHDTVLVCGDTSWAMRFEQALPDLQFVAALPGHKILLRGNHDYWWGGVGKLRREMPEGLWPLQNDSVDVEGWSVCGSRGWLLPTPETSPEDRRIYERELGRLRLSLESSPPGRRRIAMLHYPPYAVEDPRSAVLDLLLEFEVEACVYGHLHNMQPGTYPDGSYRGIQFHCVSVDLVDFAPRRLELLAPPGAGG